jgi:hypothetical protein
MHFCKENKSPFHEKALSCFTIEECKNTINILESIIEYIKNTEQTLKEIIQQNIILKNQIQNNESKIPLNSEVSDNDILLTKCSQGRNFTECLEKIINKFKISVNNEKNTLDCIDNDENNRNDKNSNAFKNKLEISDDIRDIKNYYEGKINIMEKKIKVFEILENLYMKQVDELKKKLSKNIPNKLKNINEDLLVYNYH